MRSIMDILFTPSCSPLVQRKIILRSVLLLILFLSGCGRNAPTELPSATLEASPSPTLTLLPDPTATEEPALIYLVAPDSSRGLALELQAFLTQQAAEMGLRFQLRPGLSESDFERDVSIVVLLPPDPGVSAWAQDNPETRFLAVNIPGVAAADNLSVISSAGGSQDFKGFLAGYLAAVITDDWRVGILYRDDGMDEAYRIGFQNGVTYYCGLCSPVYPPFPSGGFPMMFSLNADSGPPEWSAALGYFQLWGVETLFVTPQVASSGLYTFLGDEGLNSFGEDAVPQGLSEHWVATIGVQDPLSVFGEAWGDLVQGAVGKEYLLEVELRNVNSDLLSPGRLRLVEEMLVELQAGYIATGFQADNPETP